MSFVYREIPTASDEREWAVGFYNPHGDWQTESTHKTANKAAERVHWLNGGSHEPTRDEIARQLAQVRAMENLTIALRNMPHSVRMRP